MRLVRRGTRLGSVDKLDTGLDARTKPQKRRIPRTRLARRGTRLGSVDKLDTHWDISIEP